MKNLHPVADLPPDFTVDMKIDPRTPEGRKAMRLVDVPTAALVAALGLPPKHTRPEFYYSHAVLCMMATAEGLTPMDFK